MHSEDDQIVPYANAGPLSAKLLKNGTLKTYKDFPHDEHRAQRQSSRGHVRRNEEFRVIRTVGMSFTRHAQPALREPDGDHAHGTRTAS
jgi:hypothetical protein